MACLPRAQAGETRTQQGELSGRTQDEIIRPAPRLAHEDKHEGSAEAEQRRAPQRRPRPHRQLTGTAEGRLPRQPRRALTPGGRLGQAFHSEVRRCEKGDALLSHAGQRRFSAWRGGGRSSTVEVKRPRRVAPAGVECASRPSAQVTVMDPQMHRLSTDGALALPIKLIGV